MCGGALIVMHGCSLKSIDPRISTMLKRRTLGFHRPDRHCLHQARSAVWGSANRMKGELGDGGGGFLWVFDKSKGYDRWSFSA